MHCQKDKFNLPEDISYINGAYMSPQMKVVEAAGLEMLRTQNLPHLITTADFFHPVDQLKQAFARLIHTNEWERIALVPSVSYGIGNVANNISLKPKEKIILLHEQFPSNVYPWIQLAEKSKAKIETIQPPENFADRGRIWNERILEAIDDSTAVVAMAHVHWTDGTKFDLKAIREKTRQHGALLVIDGTQSVGAMPFNVNELKPDALVCAGYKWLMGPYSLGLAYYGAQFDGGRPIEEHWLNRLNSEDFSGLVDYQPNYRLNANRFGVGEQSNFILVPMLLAAIEQLLEWSPENIQQYCHKISKDTIIALKALGLKMEDPEFHGHHLLGVQLTDAFDLASLKLQFSKEKVLISYRGKAIRMSPNVYNDEGDFEKLLRCFKMAKKVDTMG
ncbi:MAG: aminotransferase [Saprospiraceae bacterium]|nr:MAG: aminotransferase [Saprospiraceae bacterium]